MDDILRLPEVAARVGLSESSVLRKAKAGDFPAPIKLGAPNKRGAIGWTRSSLDRWLSERVAAAAADKGARHG